MHDAELGAAVERAQQGDDEGFAIAYRLVQPGLIGYVWGLVGDDAEDVASEAWLEIARDLGRFRGDGAGFRGWTATIARHRALDHLRRQKRRPRTSLLEQDMNPEPVDPRTPELETLLDVASRPGALSPAAEEKALHAFRTAHEEGAHAAPPRRRRRGDDWRPVDERRWSRSFKALLAALVAAAALGGVAVAAGAGDIPSPFGGGAEPKPGQNAPTVPGAAEESAGEGRVGRPPQRAESGSVSRALTCHPCSSRPARTAAAMSSMRSGFSVATSRS